MTEKVQHSAKTAEVKRENSASKTRAMDYSQSMSSPVDQVLYLQRTIGNQAVQRLIRSGAVQAELKIGQPVDKYEQEADRVADAVMRMPEPNKEKGESHIAIVGGRIVVITEEEMEARRQALINKLKRKIVSSIEEAKNGKKIHVNHMEEVRGVAGLLSDWWNDIIPPWTGMWWNSILLFNEAKKRIDEGNIRGAYIYYENGRRSLLEAQYKWKTYLKRTIEGAEATVTTLRYVRDAAIAIEVGLLTGGTAYAVGGGGAAVTTGATLLGVGSAAATSASLDTPLSKDVRGTLKEIKAAGLKKNLKYAIYGLGGIIFGIGEGLKAIGESLLTLFTNPVKFLDDFKKLPDVISELYKNRKVLWNYFQKLPPEKQAFAIGRFTGNIEAVLISIKATKDIGGALKEMAAVTGAGGPAIGSQGGVATLVNNLNVIRAEALVIVTGQTATAAVAGGLPMAVPHSFMSGMQDVRDKLGEGPHTEAMHETGKAGIGAAEKPKHHVKPKPPKAPPKSKHAKQRGAEGRRTGPAFNDAQRARQSDVFIQRDGRYVLRGSRGREHIFERNGELLTSIDRSRNAHIGKVRKGERLPVTSEQYEVFKKTFR